MSNRMTTKNTQTKIYIQQKREREFRCGSNNSVGVVEDIIELVAFEVLTATSPPHTTQTDDLLSFFSFLARNRPGGAVQSV